MPAIKAERVESALTYRFHSKAYCQGLKGVDGGKPCIIGPHYRKSQVFWSSFAELTNKEN